MAGAEKRKEAQRQEAIKGPATELACPDCGGVLHERAPAPLPKGLVKGPPRSRNRRIRKKQAKRWVEKNRWLVTFHLLHQKSPVRKGFLCAGCGQQVGFYRAIGTNMIQVEKLPKGALPYYAPAAIDPD